VCVVAGTHYIPIALPSILASLFLLLPLVAIAAKLQASGTGGDQSADEDRGVGNGAPRVEGEAVTAHSCAYK
jgi:hypothetical protein